MAHDARLKCDHKNGIQPPKKGNTLRKLCVTPALSQFHVFHAHVMVQVDLLEVYGSAGNPLMLNSEYTMYDTNCVYHTVIFFCSSDEWEAQWIYFCISEYFSVSHSNIFRDAKLKCGCDSGCKAQMWLCCRVYKLLGDSMWPLKRVAKLNCGFVEMCISYGRLKCGLLAMYGTKVAPLWITRDTNLCETQMWIIGESK